MNWKEAVPEAIRDMQTVLYVKNVDDRDCVIDCGLGTSPVGAPPSISEKWQGLLSDDISTYSYPGEVLSASVSRFWNGAVKPEELVFANGSDTIIVLLAKALGGIDGTILGMAPQFTDAPVHFELSGCKSRYINLSAPDYKISSDEIIKNIDEDITLVYLDRPHNPTGQVMPLEEVAAIAERASKAGALLIVDEAYGDFIPESQSTINLDAENLICIKSFSKAWGLGGVRAGYAVIRDPLAREYYKRVSPPFTVGSLALDIVPEVLEKNISFLKCIRKEIRYVKYEVMKVISGTPGFSIAETCPSVSIMLVSHENRNLDLYDLLISSGIKTESGTGFLNLGANSVRLRVPHRDELEVFRQLWRKATRQEL